MNSSPPEGLAGRYMGTLWNTGLLISCLIMVRLPHAKQSFNSRNLFQPLLLCVSSAVYNLYLHPLRRYPGPFLARATRFWYIYRFSRGSLALAVKVAHEEYGQTIRISPADLSYTNSQAWRDIYGHRRGEKENMKDLCLHMRDSPHDHILFASRERHSVLRHLLSNGFSDKALREQEPAISQYVDLLIERLHERCQDGEKPLNIVDWYNVSPLFWRVGRAAHFILRYLTARSLLVST
jgi:hypothetical protein